VENLKTGTFTQKCAFRKKEKKKLCQMIASNVQGNHDVKQYSTMIIFG